MTSISVKNNATSAVGGTEAPFSGKYYDFFEPGQYHCVACDHPLFASETKYNSGSGW